MSALALALLGACPLGAPAPGADGLESAASAPSARAVALNREGRALYQKGRFREARAKYDAARSADPAFLGPALNIACSLVREERFAEGAEEAARLVRRAFVPWGREVTEAADLAPLHVRPENRVVEQALAEARLEWGARAMAGLFFVARTQPPVRLDGDGVLVLGVHQEIVAYLPETGRYLPITADGGGVLAFVRSDDGRVVVYVRGGKLVRRPGVAPALRGLSLRRLDVPSMTTGPAVEIDGDVTEIELTPLPSGDTRGHIRRADGSQHAFVFDGAALRTAAAPSLASPSPAGVRLLARGVVDPGGERVPRSAPGQGRSGSGARAACAFDAHDDFGGTGVPAVRVRSERTRFVLRAPHGAGLHGLPFGVREMASLPPRPEKRSGTEDPRTPSR